MKSWAEISREALAKNFRALQAVAGSDVETLAVVKANGYGHGATLCAPALVAAGAGWLGVTDVAEGIAVRESLEGAKASGFEARILVMCGIEPGDAAALVEHRLTPMVWTIAHVEAMEQAAREAEQRVAVHLEIDTGMSRQGVAAEDVLAVAKRIAASAWVRCEGVASHLACAEVAGAAKTVEAQHRFAWALGQVAEAEILPEYVHLGNTSAVDEGSTMSWIRDLAVRSGAVAMVRSGLAPYGYCLPLEGAEPRVPRLQPNLQPVMTWKARVTDVRSLAAGAAVGYGATFVAEDAMRLALLPVGYADGFRREASSGVGNGWVMVNGRRAPVVGRVSMNLTMVDVTAIAGVDVGTEVVLLGAGVSAEDHARWANTIAYEILCGIRATLVPR